MSSFKTIEWKDGRVLMIDQTKLPGEEVYVECLTYEDVADAIKRMVIRGAPAIGVAAAMGVALGAQGIETSDRDIFMSRMKEVSAVLLATRPTAVNLAWAIKRMGKLVEGDGGSVAELKARLAEEAVRVLDEDVRTCMDIGRWGAGLIEEGSVVMTHCNAGALATGGYGTALGVIRAAQEAGKGIKVIATETRPFLQGARLTAWELDRDGIPVTLITDNMVGHVMRSGMVDAVVVGADRIARNGDVANKIGTYTISVLARTHGIPFYVAAPLSTVDYECPEGKEIPIEERNPDEVTHVSGKKVAADVNVFNPAFDVTPYENVTSIITEAGIAGDPYEGSLENLRKR